MIEKIGLKALRTLNPETAHGVAIKALKSNMAPLAGLVSSQRLKTNVAGLQFENPIGLAAGFDKNAEVIPALSKSGFGFIEVGAVTPRAQAGNPKPRLFRLTEDKAAINRFGFNNEGMEMILPRLKARPQSAVPVGLNLGANKDSSDRAADYARVLEICGPHVDFATVNVSSPNTEKLRDLQGAEALGALLRGVLRTRDDLGKTLPIFLKIAPDLDLEAIKEIGTVALALGIDGIIATNTTLSREGLRSKHKGEMGGLSGAPLFESSTRVLAQLSQATGGRIPIIGVGGVSNARQALDKIEAGASLVQLYTALVYEGIGLAARIAKDLDSLLKKEGYETVSQAIGAKRADWLQ